MSEYTYRNVIDHVSSNLSSLIGLAFTSRCDVADIIRDALDSDRATAPEAIYYHDGWNIVAGRDFNSVDVDVDFSDCKSATDCVMLEANMILDSAYHSEVENALTDIVAAVDAVFNLDASDFPGAGAFYIDEIRSAEGVSLDHLPHDYEFDIDADDTESACVWLKQRKITFKVRGMKFIADLLEQDAE